MGKERDTGRERKGRPGRREGNGERRDREGNRRVRARSFTLNMRNVWAAVEGLLIERSLIAQYNGEA